MLSAFILTEHRYPAMPLVEQPVHERFVNLGPLVTYSPISRSADYIFTLLQRSEGLAYYLYKPVFRLSSLYKSVSYRHKSLRGQSRDCRTTSHGIILYII